MSEDYKSQRDRYMAFSLAAADLLIEVDNAFRIVKTIGATQALLSELGTDILGRDVADIFIPADRSFARRLMQRAQKVGRIEPCAIRLDQGNNQALNVNMGACHLPNQNNSTFLSLTVLAHRESTGAHRDEETGLLDSSDYQEMTARALAHPDKAPKEMKLVRLFGLSRAVRGLNKAQAETLLSEIGSVLRAQSIGGSAAARLSAEEFSYLPPVKGSASPEALTRDFKAVAVAAGLAENSFTPTVMSLELSTGNLDQESVARALSYAVTNFCKPEKAMIKSLEDGLKSAMAETVQHFDSIRNLIEDRNFVLFYQPVVNLKDRTLHHYEALMRFSDGRKPYDIIRMSEQLGLIHDFDLAVCRRALEMLEARPDVTVAVNISGSSLENESFRESLRQLLMPFRDLDRLMFELTESSEVKELDAVGTFLRWLRRSGFRVCLDDFGAGAAAYAYLRSFDVDFVKIDGPFLREARDNPRQRALIRSVSTLCRELKSEVIAEMIEDEAMVQLCVEMGITFGQGYHLGKPKPLMLSAPESVSGRRKGFVESWS